LEPLELYNPKQSPFHVLAKLCDNFLKTSHILHQPNCDIQAKMNREKVNKCG
jgi:hypothetical protein